MMPVITFPIKLSFWDESLVNCFIPNETLSLSKSTSRILNLTRSFNLYFFMASSPESSHEISDK